MTRKFNLKADTHGYTLSYQRRVKGEVVDIAIGHYTTLTNSLRAALEQSIKGVLARTNYSLDRPGITALIEELGSLDQDMRDLLSSFRSRLQDRLQDGVVEAPTEKTC